MSEERFANYITANLRRYDLMMVRLWAEGRRKDPFLDNCWKLWRTGRHTELNQIVGDQRRIEQTKPPRNKRLSVLARGSKRIRDLLRRARK